MALFFFMWLVQVGGTVRSGGMPIPGVAVTATQGSEKVATSTDETGRYTLGALKDGTWQIEVSLFGFAPQQKAVPVEGQAVQADWTLEMQVRPPRAGNRAAGFQNLALTQTAEAAAQTPAPAEPEASADANQSFLVSGTISREAANPQQGDFGQGFGIDPENQGLAAAAMAEAWAPAALPAAWVTAAWAGADAAASGAEAAVDPGVRMAADALPTSATAPTGAGRRASTGKRSIPSATRR